MATSTVRVTESSRASLRRMAEAEGRSMQSVLEDAVESYRRRNFLDRLNSAFAALAADECQVSEMRDEYAEWEATLEDGLGDR